MDSQAPSPGELARSIELEADLIKRDSWFFVQQPNAMLGVLLGPPLAAAACYLLTAQGMAVWILLLLAGLGLPWAVFATLIARNQEAWIESSASQQVGRPHKEGFIYEAADPGLSVQALAKQPAGQLIFVGQGAASPDDVQKAEGFAAKLRNAEDRRRIYQRLAYRPIWNLLPGPPATPAEHDKPLFRPWSKLSPEARAALESAVPAQINTVWRYAKIVWYCVLICLPFALYLAFSRGPVGYLVVISGIYSYSLAMNALTMRLRLVQSLGYRRAMARLLRSADPADPESMQVRAVL